MINFKKLLAHARPRKISSYKAQKRIIPGKVTGFLKTIRVTMFSFLALPCASAAVYTTVDYTSHANLRLQGLGGNPALSSQFPEGDVTLGGVPFVIPTVGVNIWDAESAAPDANSSITLSLSVNIPNATRIHTLINTLGGEQVSGTFASVSFLGSGGAAYTYELDGNADIRDWLYSTWTNTINGTSTVNVFQTGPGVQLFDQVRLDKQQIDLPPAFASQTLTNITFTDVGATNFQRILVSGVTVESIPEPSSTLIFAGLLVLGCNVRRRNTA